MFNFLKKTNLQKENLRGTAKLMYQDVSEVSWDKENLTNQNLDFSIESIRFIDQYAKNLMSTERGKNVPNVDELATVSLNADEQFYLDHKNSLLGAYEDRFVAIRQCEIVADAATRRELEVVLSKMFDRPVYAMVRRVTPASFEFGPEDSIVIT